MDRENAANKEIQSLQEKIRTLESSKKDLEKHYDVVNRQAENKHRQLTDTIRLTHK